jgi:hypothetical protein
VASVNVHEVPASVSRNAADVEVQLPVAVERARVAIDGNPEIHSIRGENRGIGRSVGSCGVRAPEGAGAPGTVGGAEAGGGVVGVPLAGRHPGDRVSPARVSRSSG